MTSQLKPDPQLWPPVSIGVEQVPAVTGWTRTQTYQFIRDRRLASYKAGKRRLVRWDAIQSLAEELEREQAEAAA